jgi:hypothetical protein
LEQISTLNGTIMRSHLHTALENNNLSQ